MVVYGIGGVFGRHRCEPMPSDLNCLFWDLVINAHDGVGPTKVIMLKKNHIEI